MSAKKVVSITFNLFVKSKFVSVHWEYYKDLEINGKGGRPGYRVTCSLRPGHYALVRCAANVSNCWDIVKNFETGIVKE